MYLRDSDECEVLLRLIDDCDQLVDKNAIDGNAAFRMISEAAKHHSDHPARKRQRKAEMETKKAEVQKPAEELEPVPVPDVL